MTRYRRPRALAALGLGTAVTLAGLRRLQEDDLTGQAALITGGSRGLGLALARALRDEGCRLAICARDEAELETARSELARTGAEVLAVRCDLANRDDVDRLVATVSAQYGEIDLLINNAGIIQVGPAMSLTLDHFDEAMAIDFWGVVYPTLAVLPRMRARGRGRIVTITSIGGKISVPHLLPYGCAKFAAVGFSEGLRAELARDGITVTTVVPGLMRTGSHLHAEFGGNQAAEYRWFAPAASLPLTAISAERAARIIVRAIKRGQAEVIFPPLVSLAARLHGLMPATSASVLSLVNRLLPEATAPTPTKPDLAVDAQAASPLLDLATAPGRTAAHDLNQY